ncbi:pseudouridine synthase [Acidicapsa acidisoli]|uniref:pseudouridine synthase n=1 Tax=Acidicapsa acidisoli TaxID=1615681 RepID=UPI0021DF6C59|nr:pseudouridine synthase [Acidicapsa acidisoli]
MTSDPEGTPATDAIIHDENELVTEAKPKAKTRKKKVAEAVEPAAPQSAVEAAPESATVPDKPVEPVKPAKKVSAKKAKPSESEPEVVEPETASAEAPEAEKPAKKNAQTVEKPAAEIEAADDDTTEAATQKGPEPKLERLQKILAKAGISSRRKAEELILGGRVQINGKVVMELGTKADPTRDHVRVDGKLLQGPERIRYFVLNKPKGFVTTVSDPEGRPTVMQFFATERERLYPVGRLDYLSEGLLLVTNDGELANKLTKASSGVEKTYLVKVAGEPTEEALDTLRTGVVIERGRPGTGSGRVRTAPAQIRQVRQGDNPWFEVIVIEGRNRELRKMFEEIGHHVEKIRRVGYGPLILDLEPGKLRELEPEEVHSLRLASEGKLKTRRRRGPAPAQLPTVAGKTVRYKKADGKPGFEPRRDTRVSRDYTKEFSKEAKPEFKTGFKPGFKSGPRVEGVAGPRSTGRPEFKSGGNAGFKSGFKPEFKPGFKTGGKPEFGGRPGFAGKSRRVEPPVTDYVLPPRKAGPVEPEFDDKPARQRSDFNPDFKPGFRTGAKPAFRSEGRSGSKPAFRSERPERSDRPGKSFGAGKPFRPAPPADDDDFVPRSKTPGFRIEPVEDKPREKTPRTGGFDRPTGRPFRPAGGRPAGGERPFLPQSDRSATPGNRPFRPRADGPPSGDRGFRPRTDRPSSGEAGGKPFRPAGRPAGNRPGVGRAEGRTDTRSGEFRPRREFRPGGDSRPNSGERPAQFTPRGDGPPSRAGRPSRTTGRPTGRPTGAGEDRPREYRPGSGSRTGLRPAGGPAKKPFGAKPGAGGRTGPGKTGPDGEPRVKERWRNSFTGKNKGRPKPKPKKSE